MLDHCHFVEKKAATSDDGRFIPDLIIKLPGGRNIIVDAKVPYIAYREAVEAADEATRTAKLKDHARQLREHIIQLSSKKYWDQFQPAPEFVFMFLPGEGYFSAALQHDPSLIGVWRGQAGDPVESAHADRAPESGGLRVATGNGRQKRAER